MDIVLVTSWDYQALYIDGKIALQKSVLTIGEVMDLIVLKCGKVSSYDEKSCTDTFSAHLEEVGEFPENLSDVEIA